MSIIIYVFIILLNVVFAFRKRHSKKIALLSLIIILFLMAGSGPNYIGQNDYINYKIIYENIGSNTKSISDDLFIGFNLLMKIGSLFNISFFYYRFIIIAFCLFLIYYFIIKKYAYNYNYVILFYMLYPMIIDSEQFKNFIAFTLLFVGISFLLKNSFKGRIYFVLFLFLATSIHIAFILYLPLILINRTHKNKLIFLIFLFFIFLTALIIINDNQIPFMRLLIKNIENKRIIYYLKSNTNLGFLIPFTLNFVNMGLVFLSRKIIVKKGNKRLYPNKVSIINNDRYQSKDYIFVDMIFWINIVSIIYFPLYIKSLIFYRLSRNLIILNIVVYSIASKSIRQKVNKCIFNLFVFMSILLWFYLDLTVTTPIERVLIPFFLRNVFNIG